MSTKTLRSTPAVIAGQRDAVTVGGPDALSYLQGQLSQDIVALAPGEASFSLLLHPQGKISAWFRITRVADDQFVIDVDAGWSDEVITRLNRFKLRTDCEIERAPWNSLAIVGAGADDISVDGIAHDMLTSWAGVPVRDIFGPDLGSASVADLAELDLATFTAIRIEGGIPQMGRELDDSTIPAAAGIIEQSVSFTKGCYTGQELVARIDSRGNNVPKRLVGVVLDSSAMPGDGATVSANEASVGLVTSASKSTQLDATVCLAYISRNTEIGAQVTVDVDGAAIRGELRDLPLVRA